MTDKCHFRLPGKPGRAANDTEDQRSYVAYSSCDTKPSNKIGNVSRPPEEARQRDHSAAQPEHETTSGHASALEILDAWALSNSAQTHKLDIICSVSKDSSDILEDSFPNLLRSRAPLLKSD